MPDEDEMVAGPFTRRERRYIESLQHEVAYLEHQIELREAEKRPCDRERQRHNALVWAIDVINHRFPLSETTRTE